MPNGDAAALTVRLQGDQKCHCWTKVVRIQPRRFGSILPRHPTERLRTSRPIRWSQNDDSIFIFVRFHRLNSNVLCSTTKASGCSAAEGVAAKAPDLGVNTITIQANVIEAKGVANLFKRAKAEFGNLDIVMSNSGMERFGHLSEFSEDNIDRVRSVTVKAQYFVARQSENLLEDIGRLILISSISAITGIPNQALYAASKAAFMGMVRCFAWDFEKRNITANYIAPGGVKTDMYPEAAARYISGGNKLSEAEIDERRSGMSSGSVLHWAIEKGAERQTPGYSRSAITVKHAEKWTPGRNFQVKRSGSLRMWKVCGVTSATLDDSG
ncbi:Short-chain dehydrogenase/reductase SDR [Ilyonectria robusta]